MTKNNINKDTKSHLYVYGMLPMRGSDELSLTKNAWAMKARQGLLKTKIDRNDYLVVVGNTGVVFDSDGADPDELSAHDRNALDWLESCPWTTLLVDGNHDNYNVLYDFPESDQFGGKVGVLRPHVLHLKQRGHVYLIDGKKCWVFGGAESTDKFIRTEDLSWWYQEMPCMDEYVHGVAQLNEHNKDVDYVFTHEAPTFISRHLLLMHKTNLDKNTNRLMEYLQKAAFELKFRRWCLGHYSLDMNVYSVGRRFGCTDGYKFKKFTSLKSKLIHLTDPKIEPGMALPEDIKGLPEDDEASLLDANITEDVLSEDMEVKK
jgi:hypothetical protein